MFVNTSIVKGGSGRYLLMAFLIVFSLIEFSDLAAQNGWQKTIALTTRSRVGSGACTVGDKIYVIGGFGYVNEGIVESFDPATLKWKLLDSMTTPRGFIACEELNGKIYTIGGGWPNRTNKNEAYDVATDSWSSQQCLCDTLGGMAGAVVDGKIYVMGGFDQRLCLAYNPVYNKWVTKQPMPEGSGGEICAVVYKGFIYTFGGSDSKTQTALNKVYSYNPASDQWTEKRQMPTARYGARAFVYKDKIYVIGGAPGEHKSTGAVEVYDPAANTWAKLPDMPQPMVYFSCAVYKNKLYTFGGTADWENVVFDVYQFDPGKATAVDVTAITPNTFILNQNYPNPFNPVTNIEYSIPFQANVTIQIFDVLGNEIETLVNEEKPAGIYNITWNAADCPSDVYFCRLKAGVFAETKKMILLK